jgi:chromosome segregation ATPase
MESRVAVLENDVRNIKDNVARLHDGMTAANSAITQLLTGQAQLRGDIDGLRKELKGDIGSLREELKGEISSLREESRGEISSLREESRGGIGSLRAELKGAISTLDANFGTVRAEMGTIRAEMKTLQADLIGRMEALEKKIQRWFFATSLSCAGLAFTAVRLFH